MTINTAKKFHAAPPKQFYSCDADVSQAGDIPRVMNFVWLGPHAIPSRDQSYIDAFRNLHPSWQVKVWRDQDVLSLPITGKICQHVRPYAAAADIARVEIIYQHGGWYSDTDVRWLKKIDYLSSLPFVYSSETDRTSGSYTNGVFAARPKNPLLKMLVDRLAVVQPGTISKNDVLSETGPRLWSRVFRNFAPAARIHHSYSEAMGGMIVDVETREVIAHHDLSFRWM